jgi:outer membrane murein-binding lipoprotein Lpp
MRVAAGIMVVSSACVLAGCRTSDSDQVRAKVNQFATASAAKDYATICDQVLAPSLLAHLSAAGVPCRQAMQVALGTVEDPTISIGRIRISGQRATVITLSAAKGEQASIDAIDLIKTAKGWRLVSLGSPLTASEAR